MYDEETKLPSGRKKKRKKSKADLIYGRHGRTELGSAQSVTLPVGLDPDVMQQLVNEAIGRDMEEKMEAQQIQLEDQIQQSVEGLFPGLPQTLA